MKKINFKNPLLQTILIFILLLPIVLIKDFILLFILDQEYCSGTGTGMNIVYLVCHAEIWLTLTIIIDLLIISAGAFLLSFFIKNLALKILGIFILIVFILSLSIFYNPRSYYDRGFNFWWINVEGIHPTA